MKVHNVPKYARGKAMIVVRMCDGEAWFYGAYDDPEKALRVAAEINGIGIPASMIDEEVTVS